MTLKDATAYFEAHQEHLLTDWFDFLRFPSIGADPKHLGDCARCATWLKQQFKLLGFMVELVQTEVSKPPVLFAECAGEGHTVLFYGHYDVQPVDPLEGWNTPPFEPTLADGRVYARGAEDNKGQVFAFLAAVKALRTAGLPLPKLKVIIEGQEESGSDALSSLVTARRQQLAADVLLVSDTGMHASGRPAIVAGLRGVSHFTVTLRGAEYDLHSGLHGGIAPNTAQSMIALLRSLHDDKGRVAVEGFYDHVKMPTDEELRLADEVPFDAEAYEQEIGTAPLGGEEGLSPTLRGCFLPTVEVNGVHSGYGGPGSKTVIPAIAVAKLSLRLVPCQPPQETTELVVEHLKKHCPRGCIVEISDVTGCEPGFRLPLDVPAVRLAQDVLQQLDPRGAVFKWEGASIPIVARLRDVSGAAPLLVGFGRQEDRIHSPNESYGLDQLLLGLQWNALMLSELSR